LNVAILGIVAGTGSLPILIEESGGTRI